MQAIYQAQLLTNPSKPIEVRVRAATYLAGEDAKAAVDGVGEVLKNHEPVDVVKQMLRSLTTIARSPSSDYPKKAESLLESLAGNPGDRELRLAALQQLQDVAILSDVAELKVASVSAINKLLRNSQEDLTLRTAALHSLEAIGTQQVHDLLQDFVNQKSPQQTAKAVRADQSIKAILDDKEDALRAEAVTALAKIDLAGQRYRSAIEDAKAILHSESDPSRSRQMLEILQSSYYGLIQQQPIVPSLWVDIIKDLKDAGDLNKQGCDALAFAYYNVSVSPGTAEKAAAELTQLQRRCSASIQPTLVLEDIYHTNLAIADPRFYAKAYEVLSTLPLNTATAQERISARAALAEASLTTGRYDQTRSLAEEVINSSASIPQDVQLEQLDMKVLTLAALVFQNDPQGADRQLKDILAFYQPLPESFINDWDFRGTQNYIKRSTLPADQKTLLLSTIDLISGPKSQQKLDHFHVPALGSPRTQ
jgi:hypothetical protein